MAHITKFERRNSQGKRQEFARVKTGNLPPELAKPHASKGKYNLIAFTGDEHTVVKAPNKRELAAMRKAKSKRDGLTSGSIKTNYTPGGKRTY